MNRHTQTAQLTSYDSDYARWCAEQGALLRQGRIDALDRDNLAEEIESLGRTDKREIESRLKVLLAHLLKWRFQPEGRTASWRATIREQRARIARTIRESPSLQAYPAEVLAEEYGLARSDAAAETGMPEDAFPLSCPFPIADVLDDAYWPDIES